MKHLVTRRVLSSPIRPAASEPTPVARAVALSPRVACLSPVGAEALVVHRGDTLVLCLQIGARLVTVTLDRAAALQLAGLLSSLPAITAGAPATGILDARAGALSGAPIIAS